MASLCCLAHAISAQENDLNIKLNRIGSTLSVTLMLLGMSPANAASGTTVTSRSVGPGLTWVIDQSTLLKSLTLAPGAYIMAPQGYSVTMTVNGVETGMRAGRYNGDVRLTVTAVNTIKFNDALIHNFRQAIYLDGSGVVAEKSVLAAAGGYTLLNGTLSGARIKSRGESFNGIYVAGGTYTVKSANIDFTGNGGNDFAGYGAAIMAAGPDTTLVVDGATIRTQGVIRTAAVADKGAHLVVKNSLLEAKAGTLPSDYIPNSALGTMKNVPWMLGLVGNNRATNLLGDNSTAAYINSSLSADEWGVLSVDASQNTRLTAINSTVRVSGKSGYGTYSIGNSTNSFYGSSISAPDYGAIVVGGHLVFAASELATVAKLNSDLKLGLTDAELAALPRRPTSVQSRRFGMLIWGDATVDVSGDTTFDSDQAVFLIKSAKAGIRVDGSQGAQLRSKSGVILQLMETDNPGAVTVNGQRLTVGVYHEPKSPPLKVAAFDVSAPAATDVVCDFSEIKLMGDFYNAFRGGVVAGGGPGPTPPAGRNLVVNLNHSSLTGVVTATTARHAVDTITALEYDHLGEITNTPAAAVNNGAQVSLSNSAWTVTGTSYLTRLSVAADAKVVAAAGGKLSMTVDGVPTPIAPGNYRGQIVLAVAR
jgi:hypothetical protein